MRKVFFLLCFISVTAWAVTEKNYTVLDANAYQRTFQQSRQKVVILLNQLKPLRKQNLNQQVSWIVSQLIDSPYDLEGEGEGDWQADSLTYRPGGLHINQNPVYRLDRFDCQTLVQIVMALLNAQTLDEFDQNFIKIAYGANPHAPHKVSFGNRNHFTDADFNPVNEQNGYLQDVTSKGPLSSYALNAHALLNRQQWFMYKTHDFKNQIRVLNNTDGPAMVTAYLNNYIHSISEFTKPKLVSISYIPSSKLMRRAADGSYRFNARLFEKIPTPAVVEIVTDSKKWYINGKRIKEWIGTDLNVSHLGLIYRQTFEQGELIYNRIRCRATTARGQKVCEVQPVVCQKSQCKLLMFAHATSAYPKGYQWEKSHGKMACLPTGNKASPQISCNRVEVLPLSDYIAMYLSDAPNKPPMLGLHIEQLTSPKN